MQGIRNPPLPSRSLQRSRSLRQTQTDVENRLWVHLRGRRLEGLKFRRQHAMPPYVADFYCASLKLAIELGGSQHTEAGDAVRTRFLSEHGLMVLRFWDNDVMNNTDAVLEKILQVARGRTLTPTPLPQGEGLQAECR